MKQNTLRWLTRLRIILAFVLGAIGGASAGATAGIAITTAILLINPFASAWAGAFPTPGGSSVSTLTSLATDAQEIEWEQEIVQSAFQQAAFSDNMVGRVGQGKPIVEHTSTKTVGGQAIVISTVDSLGAPIIQGNAIRVSKEEGIKPGDFQLKTDIGFISTGIDNKGLTQTLIGKTWDKTTQVLLARRLAKQQNDDRLSAMKMGATSDNTKFPNGKSIDTLSSSDYFQTSLIVGSSGLAKDLGAIPMNIRPIPDSGESIGMQPPPIQRYMQFLTDVGARPIKQEPAYLQGISYAAERGKDNPQFTGEYQEWDNNIVYPWVNVRHGGYGSVGSALQPEALLGTALLAHTSGVNTTFPTAATLDGGGSAAGAAVSPLPNYFENFSRFAYLPINGIQNANANGPAGSYSPRATYGYCAAVDKTTGKWTFFRYTGNTGGTLTGVKRLSNVATEGDYVQTTLGDVTWGTAPYLATADGNGYQGIFEGALASGSVIYETNSKGVALCFGLCLGEMALVEGYGRVPVNGGASFKAMVNRVDYTYPYGQAFGRGLEVAWGCAPFKRPDGLTPNYVLTVFARAVAGFPIIA